MAKTYAGGKLMKTLSLKLTVLLTAILSANLHASGEGKLIAKGEALFESQCLYCHGHGLQQNGTNMLEKRYKGKVPATLQDRSDLTPGLIKTIVREQTRGMAPFRPTEITDDDLNALIAYLTRNNP
jgi:mono/diheme cytochrome c family protein